MKNGWDVGAVNEDSLPWNDKTIDPKKFGTRTNIEICLYLTKEIEAGRIITYHTKPDNIIPLIGIDKETGGNITQRTKKCRICRHGTFARYGTFSLNDLTPYFNYYVQLPRLKQFSRMILKMGKGCYLFKTDLADAFRQLPLKKKWWKKIGYDWYNQYLIDTRDIYGSKAGSKHTQEFGEILIILFKHWLKKTYPEITTEIEILNYIDDYCGAIKLQNGQTIKDAENTLDKLYEFFALCGIKESKRKRTGLHKELELCGLTYNTETMMIVISKEKKLKVMKKLFEVKITHSMMSKQFESLLGSLQWFAEIMWPGKAYVRRIRMKLTKHKKKYGETNRLMSFNSEEMKDINWWIEYMDKLKPKSIYKVFPKKMKMRNLYTDGATNGSKQKNWNPAVGWYFEGTYSAGIIPKELINVYQNNVLEYEKETGIIHFEALAIIAAINTIKEKLKRDEIVHIYCDNTTVVEVLKSKNSNDLFLMDCLRWICYIAYDYDIRFKIDYITTKKNVLADALSRFAIKKFYEEIKKKGLRLEKKLTTSIIPDLKQFEHRLI